MSLHNFTWYLQDKLRPHPLHHNHIPDHKLDILIWSDHQGGLLHKPMVSFIEQK